MPPRNPNLPRYARQPRVGELLHRGPDENLLILRVEAHGRRVTVRDRIGRDTILERAEKGWWLVLPAPVPETAP